MRFFMPFLTALFAVMVTLPWLMRMAGRWRFVDIPDARKVHAGAVPRVGGIGMVFGTALAAALWLDLEPGLRTLLGAIGLLSVFGILDDRYDLDYRLKFLGQSLAVAWVVGSGEAVIRRLGLPGLDALPDALAYPLSFLFLLGTTNAMNLSDGLDGLAAGLGILSLAAIAYLADLAGGDGVVALAAAIAGAILGFLRYNTHPAMVFMGDTGSQFLGFTIGVLAVSTTQEVNTAVAGALPLLILGLPVVDTLLVMGERIARRVSPFKPDRNHFHHKLLSLGFDHHEAVLAVYALQALFTALAVFLRYETDGLVWGVYAALCLGLMAFFPVALGLRWRIRALAQGHRSPLARHWENLVGSPRLERTVFHAATLALLAALWTGSLAGRGVDADLGGYALSALLVWTLAAAAGHRAWAERPALYSCVILAVYLLRGTEGWNYGDYAVGALAVLVGLGVRLSRRYFSATASDSLVFFVLVAAATVPDSPASGHARLGVEAAVVLYGLEYLLRRGGGTTRALLWGSVASLAVVAVRGLGGALG